MQTKPFADQFRKCYKEGLTSETEFHSFEKYPNLLPRFPSKEMVKEIKTGKFNGIDFIKCGRFGGICSSSNVECRKLRSCE